MVFGSGPIKVSDAGRIPVLIWLREGARVRLRAGVRLSLRQEV